MERPRLELQSLSENLAEKIKLDQGADLATFEPVYTSLAKCAYIDSRAPVSPATPLSVALVPLEQVEQLEAQMSTLLHHMQTLMQKSIAEAEDRIEKRVTCTLSRRFRCLTSALTPLCCVY